jgi:hypothetical protein
MGDHVKMVRVRLFIAYVIGDGKSADMLANRIAAHKNAKRISRACDCPQRECTSVTRECKFLKQNTFRPLLKRLEITPQAYMEEAKARYDATPAACMDDRDLISFHKEYLQDMKETRRKLIDNGIQPSINAFVATNITFGYDEFGIFGALPTDLMHAFQSGVLPYLLRIALDKLKPREKAALDELVDRLLYKLRSSAKKDYPRYCFANGFSSLTQLTSDEWVGTLFTLLIVLRTEEGGELFEGKFAEDDMNLPDNFSELEMLGGTANIQLCAKMMQDALDQRILEKRNLADPDSESREIEESYDRAPSCVVNADTGEIDDPSKLGKEDDPLESLDDGEVEGVEELCSIRDFIALLEALLAFHGWYKFGSFRVTGLEQYAASIKKMIAMLKFYVPRSKGNGWNLQKLHDLLHLPYNIARFGHPSNYDAEVGESGLRTWAKWPAATAAKRGDKNAFVAQCAARMDERLTLETARRELAAGTNPYPLLDHAGYPVPKEGSVGGGVQLLGSRYVVYRDGSPASWVSGKQKGRVGFVDVHPLIQEALRKPKSFFGGAKCPPTEEADGSDSGPFWTVHTECSFPHPETNKRITVRCHPNYHAEGPWYDWVEVKFTQSSFTGLAEHRGNFLHQHSVPAKVLAFVQHPVSGSVLALIHPCAWRTINESEKDTVLTELWTQEFTTKDGVAVPNLFLVGVASICGLCLVVEEVPGLKERVDTADDEHCQEFDVALLVLDRRKWGELFT